MRICSAKGMLKHFRWDAQICHTKVVGDLDESLMRRVVRKGIANGRIHASAAEDSVE